MVTISPLKICPDEVCASLKEHVAVLQDFAYRHRIFLPGQERELIAWHRSPNPGGNPDTHPS